MFEEITSVSINVDDEFTHCVHTDTRIRVERFMVEEETGDLLVAYKIIEGSNKGLVKCRPLGTFAGVKKWQLALSGATTSDRRYKKVEPAPLDSAGTEE